MPDSLSGHASPTHAAATAPRPQHPARLSGGAGRDWLAAAGWVVGYTTLLAFFVRISLNFTQNSDGANNAFQA